MLLFLLYNEMKRSSRIKSPSKVDGMIRFMG